MPPLDIHYKVINLDTKFHFRMYNLCKENDWKQQIIGIFRIPWDITLSKIAQSYPKQKLDLDILINLYTKFHSSMCNLCKENEKKLQIIGIFRCSVGLTLPTRDVCETLMSPWTYIIVINLDTKFHFSICDFCKENDWKLLIIEKKLSPRGITL
jgi:hypothetical protein